MGHIYIYILCLIFKLCLALVWLLVRGKEATNTLEIMSNKILSQAPTELELQFAKAFTDLENSSPELKAELRPLQFKSVREVCFPPIGRKYPLQEK